MILLTSEAALVIERINSALPATARKVAFITTAGNPDAETPWIERDRLALLGIERSIDAIDIAQVHQQQLYDRLVVADVIFVCGGNSFYLLQESNRSTFSSILPGLLKAGKYYIGSSAGSVLVGPSLRCMRSLDDPSKALELSSENALGLVPFVPLVHFGNEKYTSQYFEALKIAYRGSDPVISIRDDQLLICDNGSVRWG